MEAAVRAGHAGLPGGRKTSRSSGRTRSSGRGRRGQLTGAASFDVTGRLAEIRVPALILHGAHDRIVPAANAQQLADGIAGARLVLFPDAGHVYITDAAQAANQEVLRFLAGIPGPACGPGTGPPGSRHGTADVTAAASRERRGRHLRAPEEEHDMSNASGNTLLPVLRRLAETDPDRPALTCGDVTLTRAGFVERVERLAALFAARGVAEGSTVTIALPNSAGFAESMFAAWAIGAVPQPISHRLPPAERAAIMDLASPSLVVGLPQPEAGAWPALESVPQRLPAGSFTPGVSPSWKLVTSGGSSGQPKLIGATAPALFENVAALAPLVGLPSEECALMTAPLSHNAPFVATAAGLLLGNHMVLMPRFDAGPDAAPDREAPGELGVPGADHDAPHLAAARGGPAGRRPHLAEGGLPRGRAVPAMAQAGLDRLARPREGAGAVRRHRTAGRHDDHRHRMARSPRIGRPHGARRDSHTRPRRPARPAWRGRGDLDAPGPRRPAPYRYIGATARSAPGGWESLGDIGRVDADGYVYITDRLTDMILIGGANVYPAEIEAALDEHPAVQSSCVIGLPDEDLGSIPHAIVELSEPVSDENLMAHLRQRLAPHKLPRTIERATTPLRDDAGKVRRSALRAERLARHPAIQQTG